MVHKPRTSIAQAIVAMYLNHLDLHVRITKFISGYSTGYTQEAHMVSKKLKNNLKYFFDSLFYRTQDYASFKAHFLSITMESSLPPFSP